MTNEDGQLSAELRTILGEDAFVRLCQEFGGTRLYVPLIVRDENAIVRAIGLAPARKLTHALAASTIRVPLARAERAAHYRRNGLSNGRIARKLGITESGVLKLLKRLDQRSE